MGGGIQSHKLQGAVGPLAVHITPYGMDHLCYEHHDQFCSTACTSALRQPLSAPMITSNMYLVTVAVRRGLVPTVVYTLLRTHVEDPQATAAHMQRTAVAKTAEQLTYRTHKYLLHAATLPQTDQAHLLKLLFYQP